jgi:hypothetical protein
VLTLKKAYNLSLSQLSEVKTLYGTELDDELLITPKENCPKLFEDPEQYEFF